MTYNYLYGSLALLLCLAGILSLRVSWRRQRSVLVLIGWLLVLLSAAIWSLGEGVEFGLSYALMALSIAAWVLIVFNHERQTPKAGSDIVDSATLPASTTAHKLGTFLVAGPLAAVSSLLACALLVGATSDPDGRGNSLVVTAFIFPLLWSVVAVWICAADRLVRPAGILVAVTVVAALGLIP